MIRDTLPVGRIPRKARRTIRRLLTVPIDIHRMSTLRRQPGTILQLHQRHVRLQRDRIQRRRDIHGAHVEHASRRRTAGQNVQRGRPMRLRRIDALRRREDEILGDQCATADGRLSAIGADDGELSRGGGRHRGECRN